MIRPRWQGLHRAVRPNRWRRWDQVIAVTAAVVAAVIVSAMG